MSKIFETVRQYVIEIDNGREPDDVFRHMMAEANEVREELDKQITGEKAGSDGVVGEYMDVILCAIDGIFKFNPDVTIDDLHAIAVKKCEKWKHYYSESISRDRSIE